MNDPILEPLFIGAGLCIVFLIPLLGLVMIGWPKQVAETLKPPPQGETHEPQRPHTAKPKVRTQTARGVLYQDTRGRHWLQEPGKQARIIEWQDAQRILAEAQEAATDE